MELKFTPDAKKDLDWWKQYGDEASKKKIQRLLSELEEHPRTGTGKPELLSRDLSGVWSRRINKEHRILYEIHDEIVVVFGAFYAISLLQKTKS